MSEISEEHENWTMLEVMVTEVRKFILDAVEMQDLLRRDVEERDVYCTKKKRTRTTATELVLL
jgi:hypothetical protein